GERLLDERVDAGGREGRANLLVQAGRARDDGVVDAELDERLDVRDDLGAEHARLERGIADADEVDVLELAEHPGMVSPHRAGADEAGPQRAHAPASFTAATMRSTSASL